MARSEHEVILQHSMRQLLTGEINSLQIGMMYIATCTELIETIHRFSPGSARKTN